MRPQESPTSDAARYEELRRAVLAHPALEGLGCLKGLELGGCRSMFDGGLCAGCALHALLFPKGSQR